MIFQEFSGFATAAYSAICVMMRLDGAVFSPSLINFHGCRAVELSSAYSVFLSFDTTKEDKLTSKVCPGLVKKVAGISDLLI